jgi:hypothetical protein
VKPELKSLQDMAHLVVVGKITSIYQAPYTGVNTSKDSTQLVIVVDISKVSKGYILVDAWFRMEPSH